MSHHLHEVPRRHCLADVSVVVLVLKRGADQLHIHPCADADLSVCGGGGGSTINGKPKP